MSKVVLLADGHVGWRIAQHLVSTYCGDLAAVVTIEDNDIAGLCRSAGIRTFPFVSSEATAAQVSRVDLGILAWWPKLIRTPLIALPTYGFVNTHPSLLPHNRGKHYNFWAIVEGAPFGVTLHKVTDVVDAGEILAQRSIAYDWTDNGGTLYAKAQDAMVELFVEAYPKLRERNIVPIPQDLASGSFHRASELGMASHIILDEPYRARDILNRLRARTFTGRPACWFEDQGETYEVRVEIKRKTP